MTLLVPPRRFDPEWIDRKDNDPADLEVVFRDIAIVNRRLGGAKAVLRALDPFLDQTPPDRDLEILDVGVGGGDIPAAIVDHGRGRGRRVSVVAIDLDPKTAGIAARAAFPFEEIRVLRADAFALPFRDRSFDLVIASMFLHHFAHGECVRLLASFRHLARRAVLVNDLRRHRLAWGFIALTARLSLRHRMFVHDAPLSVLRGFTDGELLAAAYEAGGSSARLNRRWPFRLLLTLPGAGAGA